MIDSANDGGNGFCVEYGLMGDVSDDDSGLVHTAHMHYVHDRGSQHHDIVPGVSAGAQTQVLQSVYPVAATALVTPEQPLAIHEKTHGVFHFVRRT